MAKQRRGAALPVGKKEGNGPKGCGSPVGPGASHQGEGTPGCAGRRRAVPPRNHRRSPSSCSSLARPRKAPAAAGRSRPHRRRLQSRRRKPGFYEAVAIYERGVQALQRHDYARAPSCSAAVIDRYPEERELVERARVFVRVCERETARQAPPAENRPGFRLRRHRRPERRRPRRRPRTTSSGPSRPTMKTITRTTSWRRR